MENSNIRVEIGEVCPRDGWQNHPFILPTEMKIEYVKRMLEFGAKRIDLCSFVNPKLVPQMKDSAEVISTLQKYVDEKGLDVKLIALTLNKRGVEDAIKAGARTVQFVISASEEHNKRNSNKTVEDSLRNLENLINSVDLNGVKVTLSIACALGSPFGDRVTYEDVKKLIDKGLELGISEFGIGDSAGVSAPNNTRAFIRRLKEDYDLSMFSLHLHDTYGLGIANAFVGIDEGIYKIDSSVGGMGGCPFIKGAKGNIATEDLLNLVEKMGLDSGCDLNKVLDIASDMSEDIDFEIGSSVYNAKRCNK